MGKKKPGLFSALAQSHIPEDSWSPEALKICDDSSTHTLLFGGVCVCVCVCVCAVLSDRILAVQQRGTQWQRHVRRPLESRGRDTLTSPPPPLSWDKQTPSHGPVSISHHLSSSLRHRSLFLRPLVSFLFQIFSWTFCYIPSVSLVRLYVTYVFYLCLCVCVRTLFGADCDGGCLKTLRCLQQLEEIKWGCVSRQCCRFISLLTALILLPIH